MLVPHVVRCCVEEVERRGMDEVGIYRISGTTSDIGTLKAAFNSSKKTLQNMSFMFTCSKKVDLSFLKILTNLSSQPG